jgi:hypothetical protein
LVIDRGFEDLEEISEITVVLISRCGGCDVDGDGEVSGIGLLGGEGSGSA